MGRLGIAWFCEGRQDQLASAGQFGILYHTAPASKAIVKSRGMDYASAQSLAV